MIEVLQPPLGGANIPADYKEHAGFFNMTFHFNKVFDIAAGVRYSHTDQDSQVQSQGLLFGGNTVFPYQYTSEHSTTWQVAQTCTSYETPVRDQLERQRLNTTMPRRSVATWPIMFAARSRLHA